VKIKEAAKILGEKSQSPIDRQIFSAKIENEELAYKLMRDRSNSLEFCGIQFKDIDPPELKKEVQKSKKKVVWVDGENIMVQSPQSVDFDTYLRSIPIMAKRHMKRANAWRIIFVHGGEADLGMINASLQLKDVGWTISDEDMKVLIDWRGKALAREVEKAGLRNDSRSTEADIDIKGITGVPRPYQLAGVSYFARAKRMILADEMGLGKTIIAICCAQHVDGYPLLVITKAKLVTNWVREIRKWIPNRRVTDDPRECVLPINVLVTNYEKLLNDKNYELIESVDWKMIVLDESTRIKNHTTKGSKNCRDIAKVSGADYRLCLSGTPVDNGPEDYMGPMIFLDRMALFGGTNQFMIRYCGGWGRHRRASGSLFPELLEKLEKNCYMRRLKSQVMHELPPKQIIKIDAEVDRNLYRKLEDEIMREHSENAGVATSLLRRAAALAMMDWADEWVNQVLENGEKLIIFAHHIDVQKELYKRFSKNAVWTRMGDTQKAIDSFQMGDARIIVCSLSADAEGHNLTAASNVLMMEPPWTSTRLDQAIDRAHRMGQKDSVSAWIPVAPSTIHSHIYNIIDEKREVSNALVDGTITSLPSKENAKLEAWARYQKEKT